MGNIALIDRIKYDGPSDGSPWLVYKCPSEEYVLGSQLIVSEGQEAIFFRGGEALDVFGPGTYTLKSGNLPLLDKLVNLAFGGKTPFSAEIYYVNKTANLDMKWGTSTPVPVEDPKYGIILNIGAHGQYGITIEDSRMFVVRVVGAMPGGFAAGNMGVLRYFNGLINSQIKSVVAGELVRHGVSFLEIAQYLPEISSALHSAIGSEFSEYGIKVISFFCESITPRSGDYEKLRQYKEELALGSEFYQQRRSFDIMEKLAENQSVGSLANAGIGLGMGLGAIQQFGTAFSGIGQNVNVGVQPGGTTCPRCGERNAEGAKFCFACGQRMAPTKCPKCNAVVPPAAKFCCNCGEKL